MFNKKPVKRQKKLFSPHEISIMISEAINRDLDTGNEKTSVEDPRSIALSRQRTELRKKFVPEDFDDSDLEQLTFKKFIWANEYLKRIKGIEFPDPSRRITRGMHARDKILLRARAHMHQILGSFSYEKWFEKCKHSSGSSVGVSFVDTSLEKKLTYPITVTERAKPYFELYMQWDHTLAKEVRKYNAHLGGSKPPYRVVRGSRATTVDKTVEIKRMVCPEPTACIYMQLGLMEYIYDLMIPFGLDVKSLPLLHRELARISSISCRDATIDWSSASDLMSIELIRFLVPPDWFEALHAVRSDYTTLNGEEVELHCFATMGNAVTFPLETLVFWTFAHAVRLTKKKHTNTLFSSHDEWGSVSVFGDDCIVPSDMAVDYITALEGVGFMVNDEKSFYGTEQFRESCGVDYQAGYNVRPFYLKAPTSTKLSALEPWLYIVGNSFIQKYRSYFGELTYIYDKELFKLITWLFRKHDLKLKVVPTDYPDDSGLKISDDLERFRLSYWVSFSPIYENYHGQVAFNFLRYVYTERSPKQDGLRYAEWLKRPRVSATISVKTRIDADFDARIQSPVSSSVLDGGDPWNKRRRIGGYVVAKGLSGLWPDDRSILDPSAG